MHRRRQQKKGLSTVVGTLFFIAVVFVAIGTFVVMFNAFSTYGNSLKSLSQQQHQSQETSISIQGLSFNSSAETISTSPASTATSISSERKVIFASGLWWDFFSTGTTGSGNGISYETSPDGISWSPLTSVTITSGSQYGSTFSLWQIQNTIYYEMTTPHASANFVWRYGTLNSGGSITWSIPETSITTTGTSNYYSSIAVDNSGNAWVAFNSVEGSSNNHIEVWEHASGAGAGTWTKATDLSSLPSDATPILLPLSSGGVALIYGTGQKTGLVSIVTSSSGWASPVSPPSKYAMFDSSAVAIGNTVYFVGLASASSGSTSGTVNFWSYSSGQSSTSAETALQSNSNAWSASLSEISSGLLAFYGSGSNVYYTSTQNFGASFSPQLSISTGESSLTGVSSGYSSSGLSWTSGSSSPYNVRFSSLGILAVNNNSPFAIQAVSLYIYNPSTTALIHYDLNSSAQGVSGAFDYWIGSARSISVPLAFPWSPTQTYLVTVTTDQGIIASLTETSPT